MFHSFKTIFSAIFLFFALVVFSSASFSQDVMGDLDGDRDVDQADLLIFIREWYANLADSPADINEDGVVNEEDLYVIHNKWFTNKGIELIPHIANVVEEDTQLFAILDSQEHTSDWIYKVNGIEGGDETIGTFAASAASPLFGLYTAPKLANPEPMDVVLTVCHASDVTAVATAAVSVIPRLGEYEIRPATADVGLSKIEYFQAGVVFDSVFYPINDVYWKVNETLGGQFQTGRINFLGDYKAPQTMPGPLPFDIRVGISFTPESEIITDVPVIVSELFALPKEVVSLDAGPAEVVSATVQKSDGNIAFPTVSELTFTPSLPNVATVNATGEIVIGDQLGDCVIVVEDNATKARDTIVAKSRTDYELKAEIEPRSPQYFRVERVNGGVTEVEYTNPGSMFNFTVIATILRGDHAGDQLTATSSHLTFSATDEKVAVIGDDDPFPDLEGNVAVLHKDKGFVVVGLEPGRAKLTADFDFNYAKHQVSMDVIFSRINLEASAAGHVTNSSTELLITEYIHVEVKCTNPNNEFFGDVPLQAVMVDPSGATETFEAAFHRNRHTGNGVKKGEFDNFYPFQFAEFSEFNLTADSSARQPEFVESPGEYEFFVVPKQTGQHAIQFTVRDDSGFEPFNISFNVVKPKMVLQHPPVIFQGQDNFIPNDTKVPWNSWVNVFHRHPDSAVSPFDLVQEPQGNTFTRFAHNDVVIWSITDAAGTFKTLPITDLFNSSSISRGGTFNQPFNVIGEWKIKHGLKAHPQIETEELTVNVVHPADVEFVESGNLKTVIDEDSEQAVPRSNQLGSFEIVSPVGGGWAPGIPIPVEIQCYDANGAPKPIGKTVDAKYYYNSSEGLKLNYEEKYQRVVGVQVTFGRIGVFGVEGNLYPDSTGKISFTIIPQEEVSEDYIGEDLIAEVMPYVYGLSEDLFIDNLPVEESRFVDSEGGVVNAAPFGISSFVLEQDKLFNHQCLFVSGNGLAVTPRQVPIPTERVRNAAAAGKIPEASQYATLVLYGNDNFNASMATGITAINYYSDPGVTPSLPIQSFKKIADRQMQVTVDLRFEQSGERFFHVLTGDGKEWSVVMEFVDFEVSEPGYVNHSDKNIPLNAKHHNAHAPGSQQFNIQNNNTSAVLHMLDLELIPSIKEGDSFRSAEAPCPIVGFDTERRSDNQQSRVFGLKQKFFQRNFSAIMVFGNTTDQLSLNASGSQLMAGSGPDGLPDFVSPMPDAEKLLVSINGNLGDFYEFAAYNLVTEVTKDLQDPQVNFDEIKDNISTTWTKYSGPDSNKSISDVAGQLVGQGISVSVDKEASASDLATFNQLLNGSVPDKYFAGALDQYYLSKKIYQIAHQPQTVAIAKDGRVHSFNGERSDITRLTGVERKSFGVELDGVLFDPQLDSVFDLPPNAPGILNIPIVKQWTNDGALTNRGLVADQGGTSGGYIDLDKEFSGSHQVVAKTPGADFPGIHAGYLIQDTTAFLTDPYLGSDDDPSIEDDIEEVIIKRNAASGAGIEEEKKFFKLFGQVTQRRRVNGFAKARDKSDPITTSLFSSYKYQVTTDPPGLAESIPVNASVWLRELPRTPEENVNLLVATQSYGDEYLEKAAIDFVVNVSVNIASQVILAALTGGSGNALCGGLNLAGTLTTASISFSLSAAESEFFANQLDASTSQPFHVANSVLRSGQSFVPYVDSVQVSAGDFVEYPELKALREKGFRGIAADARNGLYKAPGKIGEVGVCAILNAPFEALKDALKNSVSVEGLGGAGAAQAIAERYLSVSIPKSAWREDGGLYSAEYSLRRVIDIIPDESSMRDLQVLEKGEHNDPEDSHALAEDYKTDSAVEDDVTLIARLLNDLNDPDKKEDAKRVLNRMSVNSVSRRSLANDNIYREHKLRYGRLPMFEVIMTPKGEIEPGKTIGDFMMRTDETAIDVSAGSMVMASRTNENAGARAVLTSSGYKMLLLNASIPDPYQARPRTQSIQAGRAEFTEDYHECGGAGATQYDE